jgi:hypothetical protein
MKLEVKKMKKKTSTLTNILSWEHTVKHCHFVGQYPTKTHIEVKYYSSGEKVKLMG